MVNLYTRFMIKLVRFVISKVTSLNTFSGNLILVVPLSTILFSSFSLRHISLLKSLTTMVLLAVLYEALFDTRSIRTRTEITPTSYHRFLNTGVRYERLLFLFGFWSSEKKNWYLYIGILVYW